MLTSTQVIIRGATVQFSTTFYDVNGVLVQPDTAFVNIVYETVAGEPSTSVQVPMVPPTVPATNWTSLWDTRNVLAPRTIYWSIHTGTNDPEPVTAEDGQFQLSANLANLPSF